MSDADRPALTFITPGLSRRLLGGVQLAGRLFWDTVAQHHHAHCRAVSLLSYGEMDADQLALAAGRACVTHRKWGFLAAALRHRWAADTVAFFHVNLLAALPLLRLSGSRVVLYLHGIDAWKPFGWYARRLLRRVDLFLCHSQFGWERFAHFNPRFAARPHRVVPLGFGSAAGEVPPPDDLPTAVIIARMSAAEDYKGHRELIEVWPHVRQRVPGAQLWVVGPGDLRSALERRAEELGLTDQVQFLGAVSDEEKQRLLIRSRALVMPSRGEGFGLVYLEAMRLGRPCLVSPLDSGKEVTDPPTAGPSADPGQPEQLTEAVCQLLTMNERWRAWSDAARQRYETQFTEQHFRERLLAALYSPAGSGTVS